MQSSLFFFAFQYCTVFVPHYYPKIFFSLSHLNQLNLQEDYMDRVEKKPTWKDAFISHFHSSALVFTKDVYQEELQELS